MYYLIKFLWALGLSLLALFIDLMYALIFLKWRGKATRWANTVYYEQTGTVAEGANLIGWLIDNKGQFTLISTYIYYDF